MTKILLVFFSVASMFVSPVQADDKKGEAKTLSGFENRCGWVDNPTPANWDLTDKEGTWSIGVQGGHQADGDIPEFPDNKSYWKKTNVNYGYGCGCLMVKVDRKEKTILEIKSGHALPLAKCRADKSLKSGPR